MQGQVEESFDKLQTLDEIEATFELPPESSVPEPKPTDPKALQVQLYGISVEQINALRAKCLTLNCQTPQAYDETKRMRHVLRKTRTRIEARRKEHNAEHQEAIRFVNGIAKQLTGFVAHLEHPLAAMIANVDDAKERAKRAFAEAEAKRIEDERLTKIAQEEAERRAAHEAEQARLKVEADRLAAERAEMAAERKRIYDMLAAERAKAADQQHREQERIDAERKVERDRLATEQARLDEINRTERERLAKLNAELAAEQRKMAEAKAAQERIEFMAKAKAEAERAAAEKVERDRLAAIEREKIAQAERERIEAMRPDIEKVLAYGAVIRGIPGPPQVESSEADRALLQAVEQLALIADELEAFEPVPVPFNPAF